MPGTFTTRPDLQFPARQIVEAVKTALNGEMPEVVDATDLATKLLGDSIASNLFMLGYAWQKGWVPLSLDSLMRALELNAAAVEMNKTAFNWGRMAAHDIVIPTSCEQGVCGTCVTRIIAGKPEHRDVYLNDAEHASNEQFTPCCSRASGLLVLDL